MHKRSLFAHGLALSAVLLIALPASAAGKHAKAKSKPKSPAPTAGESAAGTADGTDPALTKADESAKSLPDDSAPAKTEPAFAPAPDAPPPSATKATSTDHASGVAVAADAGPASDSEGANKSEIEALGRREAARLAASRSEVGVQVSFDVGNRRFQYSDPIGNSLRPYKLPLAPMLSFGLEAYPLATSDVPVLRDLGFRGRISRAFALDSTTPEGAKIDTSWTRFSGEIRERLLVPGRHPLEIGAFFGADASYFVMSSQKELQALLPSARTISLRFGLDGRVLIAGRFSAMLAGAYLAVTSPGEIYEHFRDPHVAGVDGELALALRLIPGLEARLDGRYTRYFASFHPEVGDPHVAGGALDEQLQVGLGVRYAH